LVLIEVIGPLVDDHGAISRTVNDVVTGYGVVLRPGAVDQVAGASAEWALTTLLEGHGRDDLLPELKGMVNSVHVGWAREAVRATPASGAVMGWQRLSKRYPSLRAVSSLPPTIINLYLERIAPLGPLELLMGAADAVHGLPRPHAIREAIRVAGCHASEVMAIGSTGGMLLAAAGAGVAELIQIGDSRDNLVANRWGSTLQDI
jgi:phosphoglycolate phosphatase-like HAD superfamily hydrolase